MDGDDPPPPGWVVDVVDEVDEVVDVEGHGPVVVLDDDVEDDDVEVDVGHGRVVVVVLADVVVVGLVPDVDVLLAPAPDGSEVVGSDG